MQNSKIPTKVSINREPETTEDMDVKPEESQISEQTSENAQFTYQQVVNALSEVSVCAFAPPNNDNMWNSRQDLLQVLKTIQILTMKRKQLEDETESKKSKVIEPLTVRTKGNQVLLDEAQELKKHLLQEIELNRQKLEDLKRKRTDQILQHEQELQEIKHKISELNKCQKAKIKSSFSQSNIMASTTNSLKEEAPKKKRKSEIQSTSRTLFDEFDEDSIILSNNQKSENDKHKEDAKEKTNENNDLNNSKEHRSASENGHSKSARNSLPIEKSIPKHRKSLGQTSSLSSSMKVPAKENYEDVQKRMLALFQAKRKSRNSSISLPTDNTSSLSLNKDEKQKTTRSRMSLGNNNEKLSRSLILQSSAPQIKAKSEKTSSCKLNQDEPDSVNKNETENQQSNANANINTTTNINKKDQRRSTRTKIPKRPRTTYTQC